MQELYIAIIDDDFDDVTLLTECFEKYHSVSVKSFSSAKKFLDHPLNGSTPCLIVVDLNLPDIRGVDLIDQIKANSALANVPIIIYTAGYTPRDKISCDELQIKLYKKPDTALGWEDIALMMAQHCDKTL